MHSRSFIKKTLTRLALVAVGCFLLFPAQLSALELNRSFSSDMVLQRDKPVNVWGTAQKGEEVTVTFAGQNKSAKVDESGRWVITLDAMPANAKPQTMTVGKGVTLKNILVGDVFLLARQSSVNVTLGSTPEGKKAAAGMDETLRLGSGQALRLGSGQALRLGSGQALRVIRIEATPSLKPLSNLKADATTGWTTLTAKSALSLSAGAAYLGRDLAKEVDVPIGIVDLDMGHHFSAAWLSSKGLDTVITTAKPKKMGKERKKLTEAIAALESGATAQDPKTDSYPIELPYAPGVCYNAIIHPLRGIGLKGILLQLGNDYPFYGEVSRFYPSEKQRSATLSKPTGGMYNIVKTGMKDAPKALAFIVDDLRTSLGEANLPLAWIAPPGSDVGIYSRYLQEVRELQRRTAKSSQAVDVILPGKAHMPYSGQPKDEELLAGRTKQWLMGSFYAPKQPKTGPVFDRLEVKGNTGVVHFEPGTAEGLKLKETDPYLFELAGEDGVFYPCRASIVGSTITLTSEKVAKPVALQYGRTGAPEQGLVNHAGLPALAFTTEADWTCSYLRGRRSKRHHESVEPNPNVATKVTKANVDDPFSGELTTKHGTLLTKDGNFHHWFEHDKPFPQEEMTRWRKAMFESVKNAPGDWFEPGFDDSTWEEVTLPSGWVPSHAAIFRTTIDIEDPEAIQNLIVRSYTYKMSTFKVYLNGEVIVDVTNFPSRCVIGNVVLKDYARTLLKKGKNHIAVAIQNGSLSANFAFRLVESTKMLEVLSQGKGDKKAK